MHKRLLMILMVLVITSDFQAASSSSSSQSSSKVDAGSWPAFLTPDTFSRLLWMARGWPKKIKLQDVLVDELEREKDPAKCEAIAVKLKAVMDPSDFIMLAQSAANAHKIEKSFRSMLGEILPSNMDHEVGIALLRRKGEVLLKHLSEQEQADSQACVTMGCEALDDPEFQKIMGEITSNLSKLTPGQLMQLESETSEYSSRHRLGVEHMWQRLESTPTTSHPLARPALEAPKPEAPEKNENKEPKEDPKK